MLCLPPSRCWRGRLLGAGPTPEEERAAEKKQGFFFVRADLGRPGEPVSPGQKGRTQRNRRVYFFCPGEFRSPGRVARATPDLFGRDGCRIEKSQSGSFLFWPNLKKKGNS